MAYTLGLGNATVVVYSDDDSDGALSPALGHHPMKTSMSAQIERIEEGRSKTQLQKKRKIKDIKSCDDLCKWYCTKPIGHLPAVYFLCCFISSFLFAICWFMDNDSSFIVCGIVGLTLCSYALFKFKLSMNLKKEVDKYKQLNLKFRRENILLKAEVNRVVAAHAMLKKTRRRLVIANNKNKDNLLKFEAIERNMQIAGEKSVEGMVEIHGKTVALRKNWREQFLDSERAMLEAVYSRFERKHSKRPTLGMNIDDFKEFESLLPRRYSTRFDRMGTFRTLAANETIIDFRQFAGLLDVFAEMEVDQKDIVITPTPRHRDEAQWFVGSLKADLSKLVEAEDEDK